MIKKIIPHICIILALVTLTLLILAMYNPWIFTNDFFTIIMYSFFGVVFIACGMLIASNRRSKEQ